MEVNRVTIITISYNAVLGIERTINSVITQTYSNLQYIIIDGGSTDGTVDIIKKYADKIDYWVSEPDSGIYYAMNKGIAIADGDWINFMNAGDYFVDRNVIEQIFQHNIECTDNVIYGNTIGKYKHGFISEKPEPLVVMNKRLPFCHQSVFVKEQLIKSTPFDTEYRIGADYDMFYKYFKLGVRFKYVDIYISVFEHEIGISSINNFKIWYKENARSRGEENSLIFKLKYFTHLVLQKVKYIFNNK